MLKSRWSKVLGILPLVGALAGLAGCANQSAGDGRTDVAPSELGGTPARAAQMEQMTHGRGPAMLLHAALRNLDLTDAQKTAIQAEIDALKPAPEAIAEHDATRKAMAEAVRGGKVDETAFLARIAKPQADTARLAKAMTVLHDTLNADQRKELSEKVLAKIDKWSAKAKEHGAHAEHAGMHGPMGHLLKGIELTDAQKESVQQALAKLAPTEADRAAMTARQETFRTTVRERMTAFQADKFDAAAFVAMPEGAPKMGHEAMAEHMVKMVAAVTPILDETQRAELAKRIEAGPAARAAHEQDEE